MGAAKKLFDLAAKATRGIEYEIAKAQEQLTGLLEQPSPSQDAIKEAQGKLNQLLDKVDKIGQAQGTARDRVLELFDAKCISGGGGPMTVYCDDPQRAPSRAFVAGRG